MHSSFKTAPLLGLATLALLGLAAARPAAAQNLLLNGDFSQPDASNYPQPVPSGTFYTLDQIDNWSFTPGSPSQDSSYGVQTVNQVDSNGVTEVAYTSTTTPGGGKQVAYINTFGGSIYQALNLTAGTTYVASAYVGYRSDYLNGGTSNSGALSIYSASNNFVTPEITSGPVTPSVGGFEQVSFDFTPAATGTYDFALTQANGQANFADASLTVAPEPSAMAPFVFAALGLGGLVLRAKKRSASIL